VTASFAATLRLLRLSTMVPSPRIVNGHASWRCVGPLSQNQLGLIAGVDPAYINRLEAGKQRPPTRGIVERIAAALELDGLSTARLLVAAGYWPFQTDDEAALDAAIAAALGVLRGGATMESR
jgi:Helix-turn-helix domain